MKKIMLILGMMLSLFAVQANAEQTKHEVYVMQTNHSIGTKLHRSPMMLPTVELVYDTENNTIDIACSYNCDAEVTVSDASGNIIAVSDINDTIFLPSSNLSFYSVTIEAEYWYGFAEISL
jgi:hypothetical protein